MTAIGIFCLNDYPVVLGDIALSSPAHLVPIGNRVAVPTVEGIELKNKNTSYVVSGLKQKVVIVHPRLVVAWADVQSHAASFLRILASEPNGTLQEIERCVQNLAAAGHGSDFELLGYLADDSGFHPFGVKDLVFERIGSEPVGRFAGTGAGTMWDVVYQAPKRPSAHSIDLHPTLVAASFGVGVTSNLMVREFCSDRTFANNFGGGYEIAYWAEDGFRKFEEAAYLFMLVEVDGSKCRIHPRRIIRPRYEGGVLAVNTATVSISQGRMVLSDLAVHPVFPPHRDPGVSRDRIRRAERISFEAPMVSVATVVKVGEAAPTLVAHNIWSGARSPIRAVPDGIEHDPEFITAIGESALSLAGGRGVVELNV